MDLRDLTQKVLSAAIVAICEHDGGPCVSKSFADDQAKMYMEGIKGLEIADCTLQAASFLKNSIEDEL